MNKVPVLLLVALLLIAPTVTEMVLNDKEFWQVTWIAPALF
jgi:hypothetical protein